MLCYYVNERIKNLAETSWTLSQFSRRGRDAFTMYNTSIISSFILCLVYYHNMKKNIVDINLHGIKSQMVESSEWFRRDVTDSLRVCMSEENLLDTIKRKRKLGCTITWKQGGCYIMLSQKIENEGELMMYGIVP